MVGVFRIETFDRSNGEQRIVGYSFFPFFLDKNVKSPISNPNEKKYILQNGCYQLPIYSEHPDLTTPIKIENLTKIQKSPCSSLLIRVEKAPRDLEDRPMRYKELNESKRYELGVVTVAPKYSQGVYNTGYCQIGLTEAEILKEKAIRDDPSMVQVAVATKNILFNRAQMTIPQIRVWLEGLFNNYMTSSTLMLDYDYFSQYIPRLGMRFAAQTMFNADPNFLYVAIVSVHPPGSLYQKIPEFKEAIMVTDIDYKSPVTAQKFNEILFSFRNMPSDHKSVFIIDIKAISFRDKGIAHIEDYGWTALPLFNVLESDSDAGILELFVNSGVFMLPIFEGQVIGDFINTMVSKKRPYDYLMEQASAEIPGIRFRGNSGIVIKNVDNQREGYLDGTLEEEKISMRYIPKELKQDYTYDKNAINALKRAQLVSKLVPKGKKIKDMDEELQNLIKANYLFDQ